MKIINIYRTNSTFGFLPPRKISTKKNQKSYFSLCVRTVVDINDKKIANEVLQKHITQLNLSTWMRIGILKKILVIS